MNKTDTQSPIVIKLTAESQFWFDRCQSLEQAFRVMEKSEQELQEAYDKISVLAEDYNTRLNLIAELHRMNDKIGYRPTMNPGAVTANALEELIRNAKDFQEVVLESSVSAAVGFERPSMNAPKSVWQKYADSLENAVRQVRAKYNRNGKR